MKLDLPVFARPSENTLLGLVFAAIFITGLGIFSLSASIIVSSAFLAVSSLAAYSVAKRRNDLHAAQTDNRPDVIETLNRRLASVEGSVKGIENRIASIDTAVHAQVTRQMDPLIQTVQLLADIIGQHHQNAPPKVNAEPEPVSAPSFNPLQQRRSEALIREGLQSGRLITTTQDIVALPTSRPAYRLFHAQIENSPAAPMSEAGLRAEGLGVTIIRLFDRVRFAHAFELAAQLALSADSPLLVCPLTLETLDDGVAGAEIADLLARRPAMAKRLCFLLNEDTLFLDTGLAGQNMRNLLRAGCRFAFELKTDMRIDPFILQSRGVSLLLSPAALILAARDGKVGIDIDPMDLVHLLDRHDIDLGISHIKSDGELRAIRAMGINLILRTSEPDNRQRIVKLRPEPKMPSPRLARTNEQAGHPNDPIRLEPEPLKARLRRMSA
jgi:hypothetical protein